MPPFNGKGDDEVDLEELYDESNYKVTKDAFLIAIDMSLSMLTTPPDSVKTEGASSKRRRYHGLAPAVAALKSAYEIMKQRIISNPKDKIGVVLFGTGIHRRPEEEGLDPELSFDDSAYPNCYLLVDLDVPSARDVKVLGELVEYAESIADAQDANAVDDDTYPPDFRALLRPEKDHVSMATLFLCANQLFSTRAAKFTSRRLFLITDNDDPHRLSKDAAAAATVRAKDLFDAGVMVDLFPIVPVAAPRGTRFDRSFFYGDIAYGFDESSARALKSASGSEGAGAAADQDGISLLDALTSTIISRAASKRANLNTTIILGGGVHISVRGFSILKRQEPSRACYVWLHGEKPMLATSSTERIAEDTGRTIERKEEIHKAYRFGGAAVPFTQAEIAKLRTFEAEELPRGKDGKSASFVRLVGFRPLARLPFWARSKSSSLFLYPSEHALLGSTRTFAALFHSMRVKKRFAIAWCVLRSGSGPMLAALVPTYEEPVPLEHGHSKSIFPQGLYLIPLPFAEDLRQVPNTMPSVPGEALLNLRAVEPLKDVVYQLNLPGMIYNPSKYPNPSLQQFYTMLRALAMDEELPADVKDRTVPRYQQIEKRVGEHIAACMQLVHKDAQLIQSQFLKRAGSPVGSAGGAKKSKTGAAATAAGKKAGAAGPSDEEMGALAKGGQLGSLTVPVLKSWALSKPALADSVAAAKRKADWIECIERYFKV